MRPIKTYFKGSPFYNAFLDNFRLADHRLAIAIGTDEPVLACEVID